MKKEITKTQMAKFLYTLLRSHGLISISFEGLMGDAVWVSSHYKAYRLHELGETHLANIIAKYKRNGEEVPKCLEVESQYRKAMASKS